jgi:hypothetical protein
MVKQLAVALTVSVLMTACGGSDNKKSSSSSSSVVTLSSAASSVAVSSAASSAAVSSAVSSEASSVAVSSEASSAAVSSEASSAAVSSEASSAAVSSEASSAAVSSVASSLSQAATDLYYDFEADAVGTANAVSGYNGNAPESAVAKVVDGTAFAKIPAQVDSVRVLKVMPGNWDSGIKVTMVLPEGKTLADYDISFDLYIPTVIDTDFLGGDNGYKTLAVVAGPSVSGKIKNDVVFDGDAVNYYAIGEAAVGRGAGDGYAANEWVTVTISGNAAAKNVSGTFELGIGIGRPAGSETDFYLLDNIILLEK